MLNTADMAVKKEKPRDRDRGARIRFVRENVLGLDSQEDFAKLIGEGTRGMVGNWELGGGIKPENLQRIADLDPSITVDWLLRGVGPAPAAKSKPPEIVVLNRVPVRRVVYLGRWLDHLKMTPEELAAKLGQPISLIEGFVDGNPIPNEDWVYQIEKRLGLKENALYGRPLPN